MPELRTMPWIVVVVSAQFLVMLDSSILNVALPSIAADMDVTTTGWAWILNAYFLTFGGFLLVAGRAADVIGRRRMFLVGAALLTLGSVAGGCCLPACPPPCPPPAPACPPPAPTCGSVKSRVC